MSSAWVMLPCVSHCAAAWSVRVTLALRAGGVGAAWVCDTTGVLGAPFPVAAFLVAPVGPLGAVVAGGVLALSPLPESVLLPWGLE